jgi:hypothetical protein
LAAAPAGEMIRATSVKTPEAIYEEFPRAEISRKFLCAYIFEEFLDPAGKFL